MIKQVTFASLLFLFSCDMEQKDTDDKSHVEEKKDHGHANHHMNKSSFEDLVKNFESPERDKWQKPETVVQFLGDLKNKTIIDIGAGTGYFEFRMNEPTARIIAADVDDRFIEYINKRIAKEQAFNIRARKAEYEHPPVNSEEADVVFMVDVYHHIENRVAYFKQVKQGLKKGGSLVIVDFKMGDFEKGPPDEMKLPPNKVVAEMKEAGVSLVKEDTLSLEYQYLLKFN